jgi:hypothetical protein
MKFLFLLSVMNFATKSSFHEPTQTLPTKLKVVVTDVSGVFIEGVSISIYETKEDYQSSENAVFTGITDKRGRVTFKEAKLIPYFVEAKKGDLTNIGYGVEIGKLSEGKVNRVVTVIE